MRTAECLKITSLCCRICGRLVQSLRKKVSFHFCQFLSKSFQNDRSVPSKPVLFTTKLALHPSSYKFKKNYIYDVRETRILKVTKICTLHRRFFAWNFILWENQVYTRRVLLLIEYFLKMQTRWNFSPDHEAQKSRWFFNTQLLWKRFFLSFFWRAPCKKRPKSRNSTRF